MILFISGIWLIVMGTLAACGEDDGEGGAPDLFLGLSGVVIVLLVAWGITRAIRKSR